MDIVRRYDWPQSSVSEMLHFLTNSGILYKDNRTRTYIPTPMFAALGRTLQPDYIANGRLLAYMTRLSRSCRCGVGLFGKVNTRVQIFDWIDETGAKGLKVSVGQSDVLTSSSAGLLLLSTLDEDNSDRLLRRINAETVDSEARPDLPWLRQRIRDARSNRHAAGMFGFATSGEIVVVPIPDQPPERQLVLGAVFPEGATFDLHAVLGTLQDAVNCRFSDNYGSDGGLLRQQAISL